MQARRNRNHDRNQTTGHTKPGNQHHCRHHRPDSSDLNEQTNLLHDLDLDSLALFEIVIDLEAAYDLRISDEEIENLRTIGEIVSFIARRLDQ